MKRDKSTGRRADPSGAPCATCVILKNTKGAYQREKTESIKQSKEGSQAK